MRSHERRTKVARAMTIPTVLLEDCFFRCKKYRRHSADTDETAELVRHPMQQFSEFTDKMHCAQIIWFHKMEMSSWK